MPLLLMMPDVTKFRKILCALWCCDGGIISICIKASRKKAENGHICSFSPEEGAREITDRVFHLPTLFSIVRLIQDHIPGLSTGHICMKRV